MSGTPFPLIPFLTTVSLNYENKKLIADQVLPRVPVEAQLFRYFKFALGDAFTVPDTKVGRTSRPTQVEFGRTNVDASTLDYALDAPIPNADKANAAAAGFDPEVRATQLVTNLIQLDREIRAAGLVFNAANYAAANKVTLTYPWTDRVNSDPIGDIQTALDSMIMRPTILVLGRVPASALQRHPEIVQAFYGDAATSGIVPLDFIAKLFSLEAVYVGEAFFNSAKPGQTMTSARAWGKFGALIYRDSLATADMGTTFGFTAQWGTRIAGRIDDPHMGMRGGVQVRVGESVREVLTAPDLGYLFSNAAA
jgi:hypothetical protein